MKQYFELLPPKLKNFFARYPPTIKYAEKPVLTTAPDANPFLPNKHPVTNKYHEPVYSRRRMSDIYKLSYQYGLHTLLPPINKLFFEEKYYNKKLMRGILFPKGHKHELVYEERMEKMRNAIKNADQYILEVKGSKYLKKLERRKKEKVKSWF